MPDPMTPEMNIPPKPEAPPPAAKPVPEAAATEPVKEVPLTPATARAELEKIAKSASLTTEATPSEPTTPATGGETTAPTAEAKPDSSTPATIAVGEGKPEAAPSREQVTQILTETSQLLLDLRDMRVMATALATQAADTPLGNQFRNETLHMIKRMSTEGLPAETAAKLSAIQTEVVKIPIPEIKPEENALVALITDHNAAHPNLAVPDATVNAIREGKLENTPAVAHLLQSSPELSGRVWAALSGKEDFKGFTPTPESVLMLAGISPTPENLKNAKDMFGVVKSTKDHLAFITNAIPTVMVGGMMFSFFAQIAGISEPGAH